MTRSLRTLVLGGARSGKSTYAEGLLLDQEDVLYVATGGTREGDQEWAQRVALHRERRPASWRTAETGDLLPLLADRDDRAPLLVDCLGLWLTGVMDDCGAWDDERWAVGAEQQVAERCAEFADGWLRAVRPVTAVSNEVGLGVVPATVAGRRFRDTLGRLNMVVANASDNVVLVVAGQVLSLKLRAV